MRACEDKVSNSLLPELIDLHRHNRTLHAVKDE